MKPKTLLSIFLSMTLLTLSCSKELDTRKENTVIKMTDEKLVKKVESFIQLAKDVKEGKILKSGEKMPIPDAIANIDESLNYEYVFHTESYGDIITETIEIILPIIPAEDKTYTVDAAVGYNDAVSKISSKYRDIVNGDKKLIGIIVENKGLYNSNSIKLMVTAQIGIGQPVFSDEGKDWWWIRDSRSCDETISGIGAPNVIEGKVWAYWRPAPQPNTRIWFTNCPPAFKYDNPKAYRSLNDPLDNYCDYALFYASDRFGITDTEKCLSGESLGTEIDFYTRSVNPIIDTLLVHNNLLSFKCVEFNDAPGSDDFYPTIEHHMKVTLGIKHSMQFTTEVPISIDNILQ